MDIDYGKKALKMPKKAATRLRTHNWDKGRGQPGWVYVEKVMDGHRTVSAGETFNANVENVGPAKTEMDMVMPWNRDFKTTGGESCTGSSISRRIAFTCPPQVYPSEDQHFMDFLHEVAAVFSPGEMDRLADPHGRIITGSANATGSFRRRHDSRASVAKHAYRVREVDSRRGTAEGPVNRILHAVSAVVHGSVNKAFAAAGMQRVNGTIDRARAIELVDADEQDHRDLEDERRRLDEDLLGVGVDEEGWEAEMENSDSGHASDSKYSRLCKYMLPLTCLEFGKWDKEWQQAKMGLKFLSNLRAAGLSRMCFSPWCCVFVTFKNAHDLATMTGTVTLDIITRADSQNMRHGYRTARSTV